MFSGCVASIEKMKYDHSITSKNTNVGRQTILHSPRKQLWPWIKQTYTIRKSYTDKKKANKNQKNY